MGYVELILAIVFEIIATAFLKLSNNFTNVWYSFGTIISYCLCYYLFSLSLKSIALGVDNDDAGDKFVEKMQKFQARDIDGNVLQILSAQPNTKYGKDWNDVLKHVRQVQASTLKTRLAKAKYHAQTREVQFS